MNPFDDQNGDPRQTLRELGEDGLLRLLGPMLRRHTDGLPLGTGDDVAVTDPDDKRLVWTIDAMVEGTHFRLRGPEDCDRVGRKLAASNLSDLASKGAEPRYALLSFGAPGDATRGQIAAFFQALDEELTAAGARLIGGDTVRAQQWTLSLTLVGALDADAPIAARHNVRPGQAVYVTGWPGRSGAGLAALETGNAANWPSLADAHTRPRARLVEGRALVRALPDLAMLDVSDGVARDLRRIADASSVKIVLEEAHFLYDDALAAFARETGRPAREFYLFGGEDYELAFTTSSPPQEVTRALRDVGSKLPVTRIGRTEPGSGLYLESADGEIHPLEIKGFEHFA